MEQGGDILTEFTWGELKLVLGSQPRKTLLWEGEGMETVDKNMNNSFGGTKSIFISICQAQEVLQV